MVHVNKILDKKKIIILITACFFAICMSWIWSFFNPIIIHKPYAQNVFLSNNLFNPIDTVDFTHGKNRIIIYTYWEDIGSMPNEIRKWTLLECNDNKLIEDIKDNFIFERISKSFVETTDFDSRIFFFKNNALVFSSKFMMSECIQLYFQNTAWTFATNYNELIKSFSEFSPIYFPIIKID